MRRPTTMLDPCPGRGAGEGGSLVPSQTLCNASPGFGIFPGELPPQCAALLRTNLNVQELLTRAILEQNKEHVYHAALMDPLGSAVLSTKPIIALMDELLAAQASYLPDWCKV